MSIDRYSDSNTAPNAQGEDGAVVEWRVVILFTPSTKVMSVVIFDLKEEGQFGAIAVLGLVMLVMTFGRWHWCNACWGAISWGRGSEEGPGSVARPPVFRLSGRVGRFRLRVRLGQVNADRSSALYRSLLEEGEDCGAELVHVDGFDDGHSCHNGWIGVRGKSRASRT